LQQLFASALQNDTGSNASSLATDLTNIYDGTINGDLKSQSPNLGTDLTTMMQETAAVGGTYHGLTATESASAPWPRRSASTTYHDSNNESRP
jgi:hypothetical protein